MKYFWEEICTLNDIFSGSPVCLIHVHYVWDASKIYTVNCLVRHFHNLFVIGFCNLVRWDRNWISEKGRGGTKKALKVSQNSTVSIIIYYHRRVGWKSRGGRAFRYISVVFTLYLIQAFETFRRFLVDSPCLGSPHSVRCQNTASSMVTFSLCNNLETRGVVHRRKTTHTLPAIHAAYCTQCAWHTMCTTHSLCDIMVLASMCDI